MKEGIIAAKIAAHAGDIAKNVKGAREWDNKMSKARADLDWCEMFRLAIDPEKLRDTEMNQLLLMRIVVLCVEKCAQ